MTGFSLCLEKLTLATLETRGERVRRYVDLGSQLLGGYFCDPEERLYLLKWWLGLWF